MGRGRSIAFGPYRRIVGHQKRGFNPTSRRRIYQRIFDVVVRLSSPKNEKRRSYWINCEDKISPYRHEFLFVSLLLQFSSCGGDPRSYRLDNVVR